MRIGIDLDGVVYDFIGSYHAWLIDAYDFDPRLLSRPTGWDSHHYLGFTVDEFLQQCQEGVDAGFIFATGKPLPGASRSLWKLASLRHEIHFITARRFGKMDSENTHRWLDHARLPFDSVTFSEDKTSVPVDIYVDDRPMNVDAVLAAGTEAWLMYDPPREDQLDHPRLIRTWDDFLIKVEEMQIQEEAA